MSWKDFVKQGFRNHLPGLVQSTVGLGTEFTLEAHGVSPELASEVSVIAAMATKQVTDRVQSAYDKATVLRVAIAPDKSVTPCWFVYAMPVENKRVQAAVQAVAPRIWLSEQTALLYAEHAAWSDMGLKRPALVMADKPATGELYGGLDHLAWDSRRHLGMSYESIAQKPVPFGPYVLGELPSGEVIAWRPVLTPQGVRVGTLSVTHDCDVSDAPLTFSSITAAKRVLNVRKLPKPIDVVVLPASLEAELQLDELNGLIRVSAQPRIWPGDPLTIIPDPKRNLDPDPVLLHPDWYVSQGEDGSAWAWRPVGLNQVQFARTYGQDGIVGDAKWPSVGRCLRDLGRIGQFGQEHPTLSFSPVIALAPKPARGLRL